MEENNILQLIEMEEEENTICLEKQNRRNENDNEKEIQKESRNASGRLKEI